LAVAAFIALNVFQVPFPLIVLSEGVLGFVGSGSFLGNFFSARHPQALERGSNGDSAPDGFEQQTSHQLRQGLRRG